MLSLRNRLLLILLGLFLLTWFGMMLVTYYSTRHEIEEVYDAQLAQGLGVLYELTQHEIAEINRGVYSKKELSAGPLHEYESKLSFQVWREGKMILRSYSAPDMRMTTVDGYSDTDIDGEHWRMLSRSFPARDTQIIVGEHYEVRNELINTIIMNAFWPILLALPALTLLILIGINRGLKPLNRIAGEITDRNPNQLSPLELDNTPREIIPMMTSLNSLLQRLQTALESERRFTADAAHELRTPMAAIKAQAQVADRADNKEDRMKALQQIIRGTDRVTHLVNQLLILARLDPEREVPLYDIIDLGPLVEEVSSELAHEAVNKQIHFELHGAENCRIRGEATSLSILARNLIDNAIRYTPEQGRVDIALKKTPDEVIFTVTDSGQGIPEHHRQRVMDRFYRIVGNKQDGSGLGLSIVKRIVAQHSARLEIHTPKNGRGVAISVHFPAQTRTG